MLSDYPEIDANDREIYPNDAAGLEFAFSGEILLDVVRLATKQKPSATHSELLEALNFYMKNDDFLEFIAEA